MTPRRPAPPLWFACVVAAALALALRVLASMLAAHGLDVGPAPGVVYGFWGFVIAIAGAIWKGLQQAGKVALDALAWSVKALWWFATTTANGLTFLGRSLLGALRQVWGFFRMVFERVIGPAFLKIQKWYRATRDWLRATFGPVLDFLKSIRDNVLLFYKTWIRPWLDLIDVTRRLLRILAAMGLDWAKALDKRLGSIEALIDRPFRLVLGKINEVINLVNSVVTGGGLFQRVALIGSLVRDYKYAWRAIVAPYTSAVTDDDKQQARDKQKIKTVPQMAKDTAAFMSNRSGPDAALLTEMAAQWRIYLRS